MVSSQRLIFYLIPTQKTKTTIFTMYNIKLCKLDSVKLENNQLSEVAYLTSAAWECFFFFKYDAPHPSSPGCQWSLPSTDSFNMLSVNSYAFLGNVLGLFPHIVYSLEFRVLLLFEWLLPKAREASLPCYFNCSWEKIRIYAFLKDIFMKVNWNRLAVNFHVDFSCISCRSTEKCFIKYCV